MNGEFISMETIEQLVSRKKAMKYIKEILKRDISTETKIYLTNILRILKKGG